MNAETFLRGLWTETPPGRVQLWRLLDKRAIYPMSIVAAGAVANHQTDIYTCVALTSEGRAQNRRGRPAAGDALALAGMWLDIDITGPDKPAGVPTLADALDVASLIATPTVLIHTGHGIHAWHVFEQPWAFTSEDDQAAGARMAAQWQQLHRQEIAGRGWTLDATHDLARLMRLPGTFNGKHGEKVPVDALEHRGPRHAQPVLASLCADVQVNTTTAAAASLERVMVKPGSPIDQETLDVLLEDVELYCTFNHLPPRPGWSLSQYDLSLASQMAGAGITDDQLIANMIAAHRAHHGEHSKTWRRATSDGRSYAELTIAKARAPKQVAA